MNVHNRSFTYMLILLHLFFVPLLYFKTYLGPIPLSVEVILIPLLVVACIWEYRKRIITFNNVRLVPFIIVFSVFFIVAVVSLLNAVDLTAGIMEIARYVSYVITFLIVVKVQFSKDQYKHFLLTFGASALIVVLFGIFQYIFDISLNTAGLYALQEAKGRVDSTLMNPNYYSAFLNYVMPTLLLLCVVYFKNRTTQLLLFAFYALFVVNVVLTYTRAAWITGFCALILLVLLMPKSLLRNMMKPHILLACILLITVVYFMPDVQSRTASALYAVEQIFFPGSHDHKATDKNELESNEEEREQQRENETTNKALVSRVTLWKTGLYMYRDYPILGVGIGNYYARYKDFIEKYTELDIGHEAYSVHNSYIKVAAETGTIGIIAFLAIYVVYFFTVIQLYFKQQNTLGRVMATGLFVGSIAYMVQNVSNNLMFIPQLNLIFWLVGGLVLSFLFSNQESKMHSSL